MCCTIGNREVEERIYDTPAEVTNARCDEQDNDGFELCTKDQGSLYSLPFPTDPCPAYDTSKINKKLYL